MSKLQEIQYGKHKANQLFKSFVVNKRDPITEDSNTCPECDQDQLIKDTEKGEIDKDAKIEKVMHEWKSGKLKTPQGKLVTDHKQAVAIALSEADDLEKGMTGKKLDTSHLQLKEVMVNGKPTHRWVDPNKGNREHAEHGSRVEFEHKGEKVKGTVGSVLRTGEYGIKLDDGRTVAKHPHQFPSSYSTEELNAFANDAPTEGLQKTAKGDDPKLAKIAKEELKSRNDNSNQGKADQQKSNEKIASESGKLDDKKIESVTGVDKEDVDDAEEGTGDINRRFKTFGRFVRSVVTGRGGMKSMIAYGTGGVGKTYQVEQELMKAKKREFKEGMEAGDDSYDYVKITGKATTAGVYQAMYEHNGKILVFDDCDTALTDTDEGLFKGALDTGGDGTIAYASQRPLKDSNGNPMPSRFSFKGRCVFVSNLPPNKVPQPLKSRSLRIDMTMTPEQTIDRIREISKDEEGNFQNLKFPDSNGKPIKYTSEELEDVINFLDKYKHKTTDLNVRTIGSILSVMKEAKEDNDDDWQHDAKAMLFSKAFDDELNKAFQELETL